MMADHAHSNPALPGRSFTPFNGTAMLARIGSDLRDLYGNVSEAALPSDLLRLASRIDETRSSDRTDESDS